MLDTQGYKHTLGLCDIYCFSTATMVAWTLLSVKLQAHCLSCCIVRYSTFKGSNNFL